MLLSLLLLLCLCVVCLVSNDRGAERRWDSLAERTAAAAVAVRAVRAVRDRANHEKQRQKGTNAPKHTKSNTTSVFGGIILAKKKASLYVQKLAYILDNKHTYIAQCTRDRSRASHRPAQLTFGSSFFPPPLTRGLGRRAFAADAPPPQSPSTLGEVGEVTPPGIMGAPTAVKIPPRPPVTSTPTPPLPMAATPDIAAAEGGATPTAACCIPGSAGHMTMPYWVASPLGGAEGAAAVTAGAGAGGGAGGAGPERAELAAEEVVVMGCAEDIGTEAGPMSTTEGLGEGATGPGIGGC